MKPYDTFSQLGYYGPFILLIVSHTMIFCFFDSIYTNCIVSFCLFISTIFSIFVNNFFKNLIKQPRPNNKTFLNNIDKNHSKQYGMPSGHAQLVTQMFTFLFLQFNNHAISLYAFLQVLLTCWQRWEYKMHSVQQLIIGCLLGGTLGTLLYCGIQNYLRYKNKNNKIK
tara:strand:- start:22143 stop:22646 length:504 start_codon:yes stop_codon:yes gene_type:complete